MKQTYILIDVLNLFHRSKHTIKGNADIKIGLAFHITFTAIKHTWNKFNGTHLVFCNEGKSWRKKFYPPYKQNRKDLQAALTEQEQEENKLFFESCNEFISFIENKTNCTVLQHPELEADDLIAGWIQNHPHDDHVIISTDSDFYQLLASNVKQYNGVTENLITDTAIYNKLGKKLSFSILSNSKIKLSGVDNSFVPPPDWIEYSLFLKIIRGDSGDNVFSAYPGVRLKGTKNKIGLLEAFDDRLKRGYNFNNFMLQKWQDHKGNTHLVLDDYERNRRLIDLSYQPDEIKQKINETIKNKSIEKNISQVGIRLLKFCESYDLKKITDSIESYATPFQATYSR